MGGEITPPFLRLPVPGGGARVDPGLGHVADRNVEAALAFKEGADGAPADRELDDVLHVANVNAVARHLLAVNLDAQLRLITLLLNGNIGRATHIVEDLDRLVGQAPQLAEVRAAENHGQIRR